MSATRFDRPRPGAPTPIHFPPIQRVHLDNGLAVWVIPHVGVPVVTASLVIARGIGDDPPKRHGLASLTGDMLDEGAGTLDAVRLADAFARLGTQLEVDVGPDATSVSTSGLARYLGPSLALVGDVVRRPRFRTNDFARVRELRLSRLRQLSRSAATMADRAYVSAVFGTHAYGHGALGTTASLDAVTLDDARDFWARMFGPGTATLVIAGNIVPDEAVRAARDAFESWADPPDRAPLAQAPVLAPDPRILLVDRPGALQTELRVGHLGPPRATDAYHALVVLNAVLGGQFTSRINRRLREEKGVTYGARSAFDFRRVAGALSCETSVQADATAAAVSDVLDELAGIRGEFVPDEELAAAKASLTRGYVRNFETAGQLARAAAQLATYALPDDTFDRFVPAVEAIQADDVHAAAVPYVRPDDATIVVVGDAAACRSSLERLGRPVAAASPEF